VHVRVPATSANLGPGFDALGLALSLYDDLEVRVTEGGLSIEVDGDGAADLAAAGEDHLVVRALRAGFAAFSDDGRQPPGLALRCVNRIPHGRGLGSSAAAIVGGLLAAQVLARRPATTPATSVAPPNAALPNAALPNAVTPGVATPGAADPAGDLLTLATEMEGHPDNVAACLAGGLTIAWTTKQGPRLARLEPIQGLRPVICIAPSDVAVRTEVARKALPGTVPHHEAAANAGRAALLVAALTQEQAAAQLFDATEDWLHQTYRAEAMPDTYALVSALREHGVPAVVSGAGPSVLAFATEEAGLDRLDSIVGETGKAWHISSLDVARQGARVLHPGTGGPSGTPLLHDTDGCEGMP
jgi:homoserine kinase